MRKNIFKISLKERQDFDLTHENEVNLLLQK